MKRAGLRSSSAHTPPDARQTMASSTPTITAPRRADGCRAPMAPSVQPALMFVFVSMAVSFVPSYSVRAQRGYRNYLPSVIVPVVAAGVVARLEEHRPAGNEELRRTDSTYLKADPVPG